LLNQSAVLALLHHGSDQLKAQYLPKLVSGEWTGTMNLTEPQAGSDLSAIATKAVPQANGSFALTGQKIYITFGEHDLAQNIIHLVLARLPDAPEGSRGISLFLVPKFLDNNVRNHVACVGMEHKMGIHASPTCVMQFSAATGFLVGQENEGLKAMFTMMNHARLSVGLQGVAVLEHASQLAHNYATERVQGFGADKTKRVTIAHHPDVQRMLAQLQGTTLAARVLCFIAAAYLDGGEVAQARVDILTPLVKAWITDQAVWGASVAVQVHGGMGFMNETAAAQLYKDVRILPIYEGTNGIQAQDLVFRKVLRDDGTALQAWLTELQAVCTCPDIRQALQHCANATSFVCQNKAAPEFLGLIAHDYLHMLAATLAGALSLPQGVLQGQPLAHYVAQHVLPISTWQKRFERLMQ
jgi:alkylation response protein AidB-like acyl-CoA dehydrogenase